MEEAIGRSPAEKRIAVVTGGNKGIGLEICRQLALNGVKVILTARDEKRGMAAVEKLRDSGVSDVVFHQLDVTDSSSIASLAHFIGVQFGKLDILVNNAGVAGVAIDLEKLSEFLKASKSTNEECIPNESLRQELNNIDGLSEDRLTDLSNLFLKDFKEGLLDANNWPTFLSAYTVSKVLVNCYTRILAKRYPSLCINCNSPGFVKTDINYNTGILTTEEGAKGPVMLALLPKGSSSGLFYDQTKISPF
ncbi:salutaridine reductase isoform X2 [Elaeis guineensis]|uniref:salutaridine reductase isoform X2 n=1 Tax=Elaeis guineensis var. tenera TaxID=51953 RepID=UPI003C6CD2C8